MTEEIEVNKQIAEQAQKASPSTSNDDKTLVDSIRLLTGAWKLILGVTVVCTVAAVIYSLLSPEVYKAELLAYTPSTTILSHERDLIRQGLADHEIPAISYYSVPLHLQPVFASLGYGPGDFPVAETIANRCLSLPMSPYLSQSDQGKVGQEILRALGEI